MRFTIAKAPWTSPEGASGWPLWRSWTLSCAAGEVIGMAVAAGTAAVLALRLGEPTSAGEKALVVAAMVAAGALEGLAVGFFQWRVLRRRLPTLTATSWVRATVLVGALGWLLGMLPSTLLGTAAEGGGAAAEPPLALTLLVSVLFGFTAGAVFGFAQWMVLQRHARGAHSWVHGNAIAWAVGLPWIFLAASIPTAATSVLVKVALGIAGGAVAGLSVGAITGLLLLFRISPLAAAPPLRLAAPPGRAAWVGSMTDDAAHAEEANEEAHHAVVQ